MHIREDDNANSKEYSFTDMYRTRCFRKIFDTIS